MLSELKHRIVRTVCSRTVGTAVQKVTGGNIRARGAHFQVSSWEPHLAAAVAFRLYERSEVRFALKYLRTSRTVIEIGGSRGVVCSSLLRVLPRDAHVISVEANPGLVEELRGNLTRNAGGRRVEVHHRAIGDGEKLLFDISRGSLGSALSSDKGIEVPMSSLADLTSGHRDFALMSDVEGAEAGFILGDDPGLEGCTRMVLEMHHTTWNGRQVTPRDLIAELTGRHSFRMVDAHRNVGVFER